MPLSDSTEQRLPERQLERMAARLCHEDIAGSGVHHRLGDAAHERVCEARTAMRADSDQACSMPRFVGSFACASGSAMPGCGC